MLQWHPTRNNQRLKSPRYNHWWKPNTDQPCIENTKKLLFTFEYSKKTSEIQVTVLAQTVRRTLREKCPHSEVFCSLSFRIRTEYGVIHSPYSVRMRENTRISYCSNLFIDLSSLKMTFKGLLNERVPSNFQINITKKKKKEART